jgi:hypothetical protein
MFPNASKSDLRKSMNLKRVWKNSPFWIRLIHWEYWNFHIIYLPLYPVFILFCLRARSFFFFAAANPSITNGGWLGESKKDLYNLLPTDIQPRTLFFTLGTDPGMVEKLLMAAGFRFPMIGKPDIGGRGRGVKKLDTMREVLSYAAVACMDYHIQEFIHYENEAGIFYYRFPSEPSGNISGIVYKEFLKVQGDGEKTVCELLKGNPRGLLQLPFLEKTEPRILDRIIPKGEFFTVSPYGNHARGALFLDHSASVNPDLVRVINEVTSLMPSFCYGRLDIRYQSRELLEQGKSFSIIEVNGAGSEPTHIYDPRHSIFFAWKEIVRHWRLLCSISRANHRRGYRYLSLSEGIAMYLKDFSDAKILAAMQKKSI